MREWVTVDRTDTPDGTLELRRRGQRDFLLTICGRVLMNSRAHRSEIELAHLACSHLSSARRPRIVIGGLGMGYTLRAALDALPRDAEVIVSEITPAVERWCRGPLADLSSRALDDPRVTLRIEDVATTLSRLSRVPSPSEIDAVLLDLYEGPRAGGNNTPVFGSAGLVAIRSLLKSRGVLAAWSEQRDPRFEKHLGKHGFAVEHRRAGRGGLRHTIYLGWADKAHRGDRRQSSR